MAEQKKPLPHITIENAPPPYDEFLDERAPASEYHYFIDGHGRRCADRIPFRPDARKFDLVNAWWLSEAATLVYSGPDIVKSIFRETPLKQVEYLNSDGGNECFVASNNDLAVVAFRGSELTPREGGEHDFGNIIKDWVRNVDIRTSNSVAGARVHRGFADGVKELWEVKGLGDLVAGLSPRKVWFTGHSLGGALATAAAARAVSEGRPLDGLYTFGSPRVGDEVFAANLKRMLGDRGLAHYRFVNGNDVVTTVPLFSKPPVVKFKHVETLKHIDGKGRITDDPSRFERLKAKVLDLVDQLEGHFLNGIPNAIEDHVPTLYSTHIWNAYVEARGGGD
ncbi:MAG TPA: lipase family protein [Pyrinomonadaceae bacterium]